MPTESTDVLTMFAWPTWMLRATPRRAASSSSVGSRTRPVRQRVALAVRSDLPIEAQIQAGGATWLDRQLVAREPAAFSSGGFGREVREAMVARIEHLVGQGLANRQGQRVIFARNLLDTLRRGELEATAARIAANAGLSYHPAREGERVAGVYRQRLDLASGRFALIDDGLDSAWSHGARHWTDILAAKCWELLRPAELNGASEEIVVRPSVDPAPLSDIRKRAAVTDLIVCSVQLVLLCTHQPDQALKRLRRGISDKRNRRALSRGIPIA